MEHFMGQVNYNLLSSYEGMRIQNYARAFRDLSHHIRKMTTEQLQKAEDYLDNDDTQMSIVRDFEKEHWRRYGERINDAADLFDGISRECFCGRPVSLPVRKRAAVLLKRQGVLLRDILRIEQNGYPKQYLICARSKDDHLVDCDRVAKILGTCLSAEIIPAGCCPVFISGEFGEFLFEERGRLEMESGQAFVCKYGEKVSGDNFSFFKRGDRFFCLLSDGMGCGEKARKESAQVVDLAENFLEAGFNGSQVLGFLEGMLMENYLESSIPTLDFMELDLQSGEMRLAKMGSAVTYLWNGCSLKAYPAENILLGYENAEDLQWQTEELQHGNILFFLTDGLVEMLLDGYRQEELELFIKENSFRSAKELAKLILSEALLFAEGKPTDDMTVLVMKVSI